MRFTVRYVVHPPLITPSCSYAKAQEPLMLLSTITERLHEASFLARLSDSLVVVGKAILNGTGGDVTVCIWHVGPYAG